MPTLQLSVIAFVLYILYYIKSLLNINEFYNNTLAGILKKPKIILLCLAFPLYFITYFILKAKLKKDLKLDCLNSLNEP
jgi:lipopolysaccharide export system permease protein